MSVGRGSQIIVSGRRVRYVFESIFPSPLFTIQTFLDAENYVTNVCRVRKSQYKSWLGLPRRLREQICHVIFGKTARSAANSRVTCDSRDREYGTFLTRFFHVRFSRYKSYEFQELRYKCVPSSKITRQKLPSSNFGFTSCLSNQKLLFSDFCHFFGILTSGYEALRKITSKITCFLVCDVFTVSRVRYKSGRSA